MQRIDFNDPQAVNELCVGFVQSLLQDGGMAPEQAESAAKALGDVVLCLMAHYKQKDARRARDLFEVDRRRFCADYIVSRTARGSALPGSIVAEALERWKDLETGLQRLDEQRVAESQ